MSTAATPDRSAETLRARYRAERERRLRSDGPAQYQDPGSFDGDPYGGPRTERAPLRDRVDVLVVGGGFAGLLAGARLRQAGMKRIRIVERGGDFGGTWYWNRYPGLHCDIESYVYLPLLEEVGYVPEWKYAPGEEIRRHAVAVGQRFGLYEDACFQTQVTSLTWDDEAAEWLVATDRDDAIRARHVVLASGMFGRPKLPGVPGVEKFAGRMFHTVHWDYDYTGGDQDGGLTGLAGKRVALIGTGATAVQIVPHLAADAGQVYVFQRTPSTVDIRGNAPTDPEWAASLKPGWHRERRQNFLDILSGRPVAEDLVADRWTAAAGLHEKVIPTDQLKALPEEERERVYEEADLRKMEELRERVSELVADPGTAEKLKPWYRYMCKRPTFSDTYLQAFNEPNVTLVDTADTHGVSRLTEDSVVVGDTAYEVDCVIFATGFETGAIGVLSGSPAVVGRDGVSLLQAWSQDGPRTLHGFYTHGFPNLYHMSKLQKAGPANYLHGMDEQSVHVAEVIRLAEERGVRRVEPTPDAQEEWVATLRSKAADLYSFHIECTPGYYNNEGRPPARSEAYGDGPAAFHDVLRRWREEGGAEQVLGG